MSEFHAADEDHEEENYFISMTDMMVGMLFLFIIMLMMFALNFRKGDDASERVRNCLLAVVKENAEVSKEINDKIASVQKEIQQPLDALELAADQRARLLADLRTNLLAEGIKQIDIDDKNNVLHLSEDSIRFDPDKFDLDASARRNVEKVARAISPLIAQYAACTAKNSETCGEHKGATLETVFIEGHTDPTGVADPAERDRKNWQLSTNRATATYRALVSDAPELTTFRNRLGKQLLSVSGYSSTRPIVAGDDKSAWAQNRRIDLRFTLDAETKFGKDDIEQIKTFNQQIKTLVELIATKSAEGVDKCR